MHNEVLGNKGEFEMGENVFDEFNKNRQDLGGMNAALIEGAKEDYAAPVLPGGEISSMVATKVVSSGKRYRLDDVGDVVSSLMNDMKNDPAGFNDEINNICNEMSGDNEY